METIEDVKKRRSRLFPIAMWAVGALLLVAIVGVVIQEDRFVASTQHRTIEELVAQFRSGGLAVGKLRDVAATLGAQRRVQVEVGGQVVDVFQFNQRDVEQGMQLDQIRQAGSMAIGGKEWPVEVNGQFVLAVPANHPRAEALARAFNAFGTPIVNASSRFANRYNAPQGY